MAEHVAILKASTESRGKRTGDRSCQARRGRLKLHFETHSHRSVGFEPLPEKHGYARNVLKGRKCCVQHQNASAASYKMGQNLAMHSNVHRQMHFAEMR